MNDAARPQHITEEQAQQAANLVFTRAAQLRTAIDELSAPEPGSDLRGDDRISHPHKVSFAARQALMTAMDHLDAVKTLIADVRILHLFAPFTLVRAAIETASTAVWLLESSNQSTRVQRALGLAVLDASDGNKAATERGLPMPRPLEERQADINRIAEAAGIAVAVKRPSSTDILKVANGVGKLGGIGLLTAWRVGSGFAHGRPWAMLGVLDREELPGAGLDDDDVLIKITSTFKSVTWALMAAVAAADVGTTLYRTRAARST